jgi:hypothetical protein
MPQLSRRLGLAAAAIVMAVSLVPADTLAQTLQIRLERKFPSNWCPLDTPFIGTFQSATGTIKLTFTTINGYDDGQFFTFFDNRLDEVTIVQAAEFAAAQQPHDFCYLDNIVPVYTGDTGQGAPVVPLYEPFSPPGSQCPWDESDGASLAPGSYIALGDAGLGEVEVSTSVVVTGLTPGVDYVIHGLWHADGFLDDPLCVPGSVCMEVRVDDLTQTGCQPPLATEESTWGRVKALYR